MKKLSLVLALIFVLTCVLVACGGETENSSAVESSSATSSKADTSKKEESSKADESSKEEEKPVEQPKDPIAVTGEVISIGCEYEGPGGKGFVLAQDQWPCDYTANLTDGVANSALDYNNTWFSFNANPDDDGQANMIDNKGTAIINLGAVKKVTGVKANVYTGNESGIAPVGGIVVWVSTDGTNFTNPVKLNVPAAGLVGFAEGGFEAIDAQYVKVEFTKGGEGAHMFVNEIEVYGN